MKSVISCGDYLLVVDEGVEIKGLQESGFVLMQTVWGSPIEKKLLSVVGRDRNTYIIKAKRVEGDLNHADIEGDSVSTVSVGDCSGKVISHLPLKNAPKLQGVPELTELPKDVDGLLMDYDLEVKRELLNYGIEHSVNGKICSALSDIRNKFRDRIASRMWSCED